MGEVRLHIALLLLDQRVSCNADGVASFSLADVLRNAEAFPLPHVWLILQWNTSTDLTVLVPTAVRRIPQRGKDSEPSKTEDRVMAEATEDSWTISIRNGENAASV